MRSPPIGVRSSTMPGCSSVTRPIAHGVPSERMRAHRREDGAGVLGRERRRRACPRSRPGADRARGSRRRRARRRAPGWRARRPRCRRAGVTRSRPAWRRPRRASDRAWRGCAGRRRARRPRARAAAPCRSRSRPRTSSPSRCERIATPWSPIGPESSTASPGRTLRDDRSTPGGTMPMPEVLTKILSPLPRPTTFVSPVTIRTPARSAARRADSTTRRRSASGQPLLEDEGEGQRERLRPADGEVVHRAVDGQLADVAARKEDRRDHVGVGGEGETRRLDRQDRLIVERLQERVPERRDEEALDQLRASASRRCRGRAVSPRSA